MWKGIDVTESTQIVTAPNSLPASKDEPTVAVAFGGGGARGMAHIHVIEVLDELGIKPVSIAGASIGAIMGAGMAAGMKGSEIRHFTMTTIGNRTEVLSRIWRLRPTSVRDAVTGGFRLGQFNIEKIVDAFLPETIPADFADLTIPTKLMVTDFYAQKEVVCTEGNLRNAIAASAAIPAVFRPVKRDGRFMIDGGISNPVPFDHIIDDADIVIGIDVVGGPDGDPTKMPSTIDSLFGASQLMMQSIISMKLKQRRPTIFLRPDVSKFRVLEFMNAADILDASAGIREELKTALDAAFTFHQKS